MSALGWRSFFA